ncbi:MAG: hypothetical protein ACUVWP_09045 [bacterium]
MKMNIVFSILLLSFLAIIVCDEDEQNLTKYIPNGDQSYWVFSVTGTDIDPYEKTEKINGTEKIDNTTCQVVEQTFSYDPSLLIKNFYTDNDKDTVNWYGTAHFINGVENYRSLWDPVYLLFKYPFSIGKNWVPFNKQGMKPTEAPFLGPFMEDDDIDNDDKDDNVDMSVIATVEANEDVTVPAGTFTGTYKIKYDVTVIFHLTRFPYPVIGQLIYYNWYKPEVGQVKGHLIFDLPNDWNADFEQTEELKLYELH